MYQSMTLDSAVRILSGDEGTMTVSHGNAIVYRLNDEAFVLLPYTGTLADAQDRIRQGLRLGAADLHTLETPQKWTSPCSFLDDQHCSLTYARVSDATINTILYYALLEEWEQVYNLMVLAHPSTPALDRAQNVEVLV